MELYLISTKELVEELSKREAVEKTTIAPYQEYKIIIDGKEIVDTGPAVILKIWD